MEVDLMIFDFDGTLVRTGRDIAASVNFTLSELGMPVISEEAIIGFVGDGINKLIERSLASEAAAKLDKAIEIYEAYYGDHLLDTTDLYPGVIEILSRFRNKKKIVLTNKRYDFTMKIAGGLNILNYFDDVIGGDTEEFMKPDPRLVLPIIDRYKCLPGRTIVIGDGVNDILLAKRAGMSSCAILNGLGKREDLLELGADYYVESIAEITGLLS
jgi:phosphoglycolate phosphatase